MIALEKKLGLFGSLLVAAMTVSISAAAEPALDVDFVGLGESPILRVAIPLDSGVQDTRNANPRLFLEQGVPELKAFSLAKDDSQISLYFALDGVRQGVSYRSAHLTYAGKSFLVEPFVRPIGLDGDVNPSAKWGYATGVAFAWLVTVTVQAYNDFRRRKKNRNQASLNKRASHIEELLSGIEKRVSSVSSSITSLVALIPMEPEGRPEGSQKLNAVEMTFASDPTASDSQMKSSTGTHAQIIPQSSLETFKDTIESHWRSRDSVDQLEQRVRGTPLQLYEWTGFEEVLKTMAASTVDLSFIPFTTNSRGPIFLGWRTGDALLILPVDPVLFSSDLALSGLRKLFELKPDPGKSSLKFSFVVQTCRLNPWAGRYRIGEKGIVSTLRRENASPDIDQSEAREESTSWQSNRGPTRDDQLLTAFREEVRKIRDSADGVIPKFENSLAEIRKSLLKIETTTLETAAREARQSSSDQGLLAEASLRQVVQAEIVSAVGPLVAALRQDRVESLNLASASPGPEKVLQQATQPTQAHSLMALSKPIAVTRESIRKADESDGLSLLSNEQGAAIAPVLSSPVDLASGDFEWIAKKLSQLEYQEADIHQEYPSALKALRILLSGLAKDHSDIGFSFKRVSWIQRDQFQLINVKLVKIAEGLLRFQMDDESLVIAEDIWQVFVAVEAKTAGLVAILFPWNRLEKGAPVIAKNLADPVRYSSTTEFVRCLEPAVLECKTGLGGYVALKKMRIEPLEFGGKV